MKRAARPAADERVCANHLICNRTEQCSALRHAHLAQTRHTPSEAHLPLEVSVAATEFVQKLVAATNYFTIRARTGRGIQMHRHLCHALSQAHFCVEVFGAEPNFAQKFGAEPKIPCSCGSSNHRLWQKYRKRLPISPQTRSWLYPANHALMAIESYFLADVLVAATNFVQ